MKIKTKTLTSFLKKFRMEGKQQIPEAILRFEKDGLKISANSPAKLARVMSWLKTTAFDEYEELGSIGMNDLENVVKVLDRFGETVTIKKEGNLVTITGDNKKVEIPVVAEGFLDTDTGEPQLVFSDTFSLTATKLKDVFKDVQMNKDASLIIKTQEKKVVFNNTGKYKFTNVIDAPTCKGGVEVKFGEPFLEALSNLDGTLEMSVSSNYPVKVMEKLETSVITIVVAPMVDNE